MGWDKINKAASVLGIATFLGSAGTWTWELFTSPDRDVMGSVVSLHSLYFGAAVGSAVLALACSLSVISWATGVYKGWKDKQESKSPPAQFRRMYDVIVREFNFIEQDKAYEYEGTSTRSQPSKSVQRKALQLELSRCGVRTPDPAWASDNTWYLFLTDLVPLSQHGRVEDARILGARFDKQKGSS